MSGARENPSGQFSLDEIRKATDGFNESKIIGKGGFGRVYKGVIDDESTQTLVAVKRTLNPDSDQGIPELETEIKMLSRCKHSNLVNLLGYCNEDQEMILVYEYMSRGNLADHLYRNDGSWLTWEQRLKICMGVARGLDYLHTGTTLSERIVHFDIKSDNILMDDNWDAKIADLRLSRIGPTNQPNSQVKTNTLRGTEVYMDPEYRKTGNYSSKSDVYSFGVVLLEVLSGTCAWRGPIIPEFDRAIWIQQHISNQTLDQIIDPKIISEIQHRSLNEFVSTASKLLRLVPDERPSMTWVVAQLESALKRQSSSTVVDEDDPFKVERDTSRWNSVPDLLGKANNIFGEPIGDKETMRMGLDPTRANRALVAYHTMQQDKFPKAMSFLQDLKAKWGNTITTLCIIYNATGGTITYASSRNRYGDTAPSSYPIIIHNGQWGAYMHRKTPLVPSGSVGAVVYRGKYSDDAFCDRMVTWSNRLQRITHGNAAYCEINEVGHFDDTDWEAIFNRAKFAGPENMVAWKDCCTGVRIEGDISAVFVAVFSQLGVQERCTEFEGTSSVNVPPVS